MMPKYRKTITTQGVKFVIESEKSNEFVDRWIRFLKDAPEPLAERQTIMDDSPIERTPCSVVKSIQSVQLKEDKENEV